MLSSPTLKKVVPIHSIGDIVRRALESFMVLYISEYGATQDELLGLPGPAIVCRLVVASC
jgi:hypothetical protein